MHTDGDPPPSPSQHRHVLIVDRRPLLRWVLSQLTMEQPEGCTVATATSAAEALTEARRHRPHAVVLDGTLPEVADGRLLNDLRRINSRGAYIVLAPPTATPPVQRQLPYNGATAVLPDATDVDHIVATVRETLCRPRPTRGLGRMGAGHQRSKALSPREQQVLELLRDGQSTPAIATQLELSVSTTKTYVARLYEKLSASNRTEALMRALRLGLLDARTESPPEP